MRTRSSSYFPEIAGSDYTSFWGVIKAFLPARLLPDFLRIIFHL